MAENKLLNLDNQDITEEQIISNTLAAKKIIKYNNKVYYYKEYENIENAFYEIITSKIAKYLNFPTATYQLAQYQGKLCVISETINPENQPTITMYEILEEYQKKTGIKTTINSLNNLEMIEQAILVKTQNQEITKQRMQELTKTFQLQCFSGELDRRPKNIHFFNTPTLQLMPNFDYSGSFSINLNDNLGMPYALGCKFNGTQFYNPIDELNFFLETKENQKSILANSLLLLTKFPEIIKEIEAENHIIIPHSILENVTKLIHDNISTIKSLAEQKQKENTR